MFRQGARFGKNVEQVDQAFLNAADRRFETLWRRDVEASDTTPEWAVEDLSSDPQRVMEDSPSETSSEGSL